MFDTKAFETTVEKKELMGKIQVNLAEHKEIFEEAVAGYRKELVAHLEKKLKAAKNGKPVNHHIHLIQPENHVKDYERILEMLEMSTQSVITIGEREFAQYVRDEWEWKGTFLSANSTYSAKAAILLGDDAGV